MGPELLKTISELAERLVSLVNIENDSQELLHKSSLTTETFKHKVPYSSDYPAVENALSLFKGEWSSAIPGFSGLGHVGLFTDARIEWLINEFGTLRGMSVLELGPLEGGHTFMLENSGADVVAIEANFDSFIRCLIVKNLLNMRSNFILGDFTKGFGNSNSFDLVVASGVLYHMKDPIDLLQQISKVSDHIFIWTHYFEPDIEKWNSAIQNQVGIKWKTTETKTIKFKDRDIRVVPQIYGEALGWDGFCGGPDTFSNWIYKDDLMFILEELGYSDIKINFDHPDHPNGPSFCFIANRNS